MIESPPKINPFHSKTVPLLSNKNTANLINSINNEYLYWDKVKYKAKTTDPVLLWSAVKLSRTVNYLPLLFGKYTFLYFPTEYIQKALHYFDMNIGGYMGADGFIPEHDKTRYLVSSIMEEAISSSIIEGANTTRRKAKEMLRKELKPKNKSEQMIVNNYRTIEYIVHNQTDELTPEKLLYIHELISKNTLDEESEEGVFRENNDIFVVNTSTSEAVHIPPNYKEIPNLIDDLCRFFNADEGHFVHPILKGIIIHFMIGWIHPFSDGNGRTARSLFYWYLLKKGYWLTEYLSISRIIQTSKSQYEKAYLYCEHDENDLGYFISYNLKAMEKAYHDLKSYIQRKQKETNLAGKFTRIPNINERQALLLKKIYDEPDIVFSVKEIMNRFSISNYTARMDLKGLTEVGFLEELSVNKIKRIYIKSPHFEQLIKKYDL